MWMLAVAAGALVVGLACALCSSGTLTLAMGVHAALMLMAWGVMMPAGAVAARYGKRSPALGEDLSDVVEDLTWWRWHRVLQYGGIGASTIGIVVILAETGGRFVTVHGVIGLAVMLIAWLQVVSALLRGSKGGPTDHRADPEDAATWRGDHYDMTDRRRRFEAWHKPAGWAVVILAGITILLGTQLVGAPDGLLVTVGMIQAGTLAAVADGAFRGRWIDTYQSLWGCDPRHPGNRRTRPKGPLRTEAPPRLRSPGP